ncbi:uncharacterized protein LTR77_001940 [Saxophila tyrrhenica]|uniref:ABC transporter domain-containing protein n=1 Tax=Saxophila tyrrhenica TaxID=1690608 RepID=A0AAV9PI41_9PEZI|nr:hypothetical protein LTR77_001940 [Saxophila tyrrhenica]
MDKLRSIANLVNGQFGWLRYINPIFYAFEILVPNPWANPYHIANNFHGREFACSRFIPSYADLSGNAFVCSGKGTVAGRRTVSGENYIEVAYTYTYSHVWRNFGILIGFFIGFMIIYFVAVELNSSTSSSAEVLVFRRGHVPGYMQKENDEEAPPAEKGATQDSSSSGDDGDGKADVNVIPPQHDIFTWKDVSYDIEIKGEPRRLLDNVSGWVRPGTLTALMGTSGAGKTTLLDVLAQRTSIGVITGDMFVNGQPLDPSFQRKTGYVQQQDLHLETATVRESLRFSAMLRQPKSVSKQEKYDYVEDVIKMLGMEDFAEAVVGVPGEGLNVEQRKLLTIGVELAAKPKLLLFLDEPTSGLDSQSSWSIVSFLRKLADQGQAVLCTIHQPSAILFEEFDRLLFLRKGGQTVYYGDIGENSRTLLDYFENQGAPHCEDDQNPAEWMLEVVTGEKDWANVWKNSEECKSVYQEIDKIHQERADAAAQSEEEEDESMHAEFAMPFTQQLIEVTYRAFQQYWRIPSYILSKMVLSAASGLFIGFSFYNANTSQQGMQNVLYSMFMITTIFSTIVQQIMPQFVTNRSLYEVRERPSKAYSWKAFLCANIVVELPYQVLMGVLTFATFMYVKPIVGRVLQISLEMNGLLNLPSLLASAEWANDLRYPVVGIQSSERQVLVLLLSIVLFIYASTFAHLCIVALPDAQTAGAIVTILFSMTLIFNGVMQAPDGIGGMSSAMLGGRAVECANDEISAFPPPPGQTCGEYLAPYLRQAGGNLQNPGSTTECRYCALTNADQFLASVNISYSERWRDFGLMWVYVFFNIGVAIVLYWAFRVRKSSGSGGIGGRVKEALGKVRNAFKASGKTNKKNAAVV